jgi:hypothetical protein
MMAQLEHNTITETRPAATGPAFERHYSPQDLAEVWGLSADTIRGLFEKEPGVLVIESCVKNRARRYRTMRIPESVAMRVHRRSTNSVAMLNR